MNKYFLPIYHSELKPWIKWWILKRLSGGESTLKAVTLSSGTLTKVDKTKALSIKEYYGNTVQDGTPTPEAPVEIKTISGDITFTINGGDYKLNLKSRNRFDKDTDIVTGYTFGATNNLIQDANFFYQSKYIPVEPNTTYCVKRPTTSTSLRLCEYDDDKGFIQRNFEKYIITTTANSHYVRISDRLASLDSIQFEEGSTPTPYESYYNYELCKIGDYKDKIVNVGGTWKVEKNFGKAIFENYNWTKYGTNTQGINRFATAGISNVKYVSANTELGNALCNYYENHTGRGMSATVYKFCIDTNMIQVTDDESLTKPRGLIYYQLATPTTEIITNTNLIYQLNTLYEFYVESSKVTISNNSEIPLEVLLEYYGR